MSYWVQSSTGSTHCQLHPPTKSYFFKSKIFNFSFSSNSHLGAQGPCQCGIMVLNNFAEPWWVLVNCATKVGKTVFCFMEHSWKEKHDEHIIPELFLCPQSSLQLNNDCLTFIWGNMNLKMKQYQPFSMKVFRFLIDAVSEEFPPIFSANQSHIISHKCCSDTYKLKYDPVVSKSSKALMIENKSSKEGIKGGNLFYCQNMAYILSEFICDGTEDCPERASDEMGCECNESNKYSSKCKYLTNKSGKQSCSNFYMSTASGHCHVFRPKAKKNDDREQKHSEYGNSDVLFSVHKHVSGMLQRWEENQTKTGENLFCTSSGRLLCSPKELTCYLPSNICVFKLSTHGFLEPCQSGGHIQNCTKIQCNMKYKCPGYYCIPWGYVCDNKWDCPKGKDEQVRKCEIYQTCSHLFKCRAVKRCVHFGDVCNGEIDCPLEDDEQFCSLHERSCPSHCECLLLSVKCQNVIFNTGLNLPHQVLWIEHSLFSVSITLFTIDHAVLVSVRNSSLVDVCQAGFNVWSLISLDASSNKIRLIGDNCFHHSVNLKIILFPDNLIYKIGYNAFNNLPGLLLLNFTGNFLSALTSALFSGLSSISILSLNGTYLTHIDTEAFTGLHLYILETQDSFLCCLISEDSHCSAKIAWFESCTGLLPTETIKITLYCISLVVFAMSTFSIIVQRYIFVKTLEKLRAYGIIVGAINICDIVGVVPLLCLCIVDLYYKEYFRIYARQWKSGIACHFLFGITLLFNILSPLLIFFLAVSRLMIVLHPVDTKFKDTSFVLKCVFRSLIFAVLFACCLVVIMWSLTGEIPFDFCSPFIDMTNSVMFVSIVTWFIVLMQVSISICVLFAYISLIMFLKKSQQNLKEATSKKQSYLMLIIQILIVTGSNMVCWIPSGVVYILSMYLERYQMEMFVCSGTHQFICQPNSLCYHKCQNYCECKEMILAHLWKTTFH